MESATKLPKLSPDMVKLDILTIAIDAYKKSWASRRYLLRLAAVPLALKLFCFTIASQYVSGNGNYMGFMLIMVPALVAEGWMLAHYTRFLILGQTWPFRATGNMDADMAVLADRARGILGGMIVFVLINMAVGFLNELVVRTMGPYMPESPDTQMVEVPPHIALLSVILVGFIFWGFRLLWLYIPYALNMTIKPYLAGIKGLSTSLHMLGLWLLCFVPFIILLKILSALIVAPFSHLLGADIGGFFSIIFSVVTDTFKSIVTTAGMAFALRAIFAPSKKTGR